MATRLENQQAIYWFVVSLHKRRIPPTTQAIHLMLAPRERHPQTSTHPEKIMDELTERTIDKHLKQLAKVGALTAYKVGDQTAYSHNYFRAQEYFSGHKPVSLATGYRRLKQMQQEGFIVKLPYGLYRVSSQKVLTLHKARRTLAEFLKVQSKQYGRKVTWQDIAKALDKPMTLEETLDWIRDSQNFIPLTIEKHYLRDQSA